jgi:hypothetical protein
MKEELSSLPGLKEELESLRARVTELSQLTAGTVFSSHCEFLNESLVPFFHCSYSFVW